MQGTIITIHVDRDFGFIEPAGRGENIWFHRDRLDSDLEWNEQLKFRRVEYSVFHGKRGPVAENVRQAQ